MTRGRGPGGVSAPPKNDDVICEQPLIYILFGLATQLKSKYFSIKIVFLCAICLVIWHWWWIELEMGDLVPSASRCAEVTLGEPSCCQAWLSGIEDVGERMHAGSIGWIWELNLNWGIGGIHHWTAAEIWKYNSLKNKKVLFLVFYLMVVKAPRAPMFHKCVWEI